MINLLPQSEKKKLLREYRLRLAVIVLWGMLMLEIIAFGLFVPSYLAISSSTSALSVVLEDIQSHAPDGSNETKRHLNLINQEIASLKVGGASTELFPSQLLTELLAVKSSGIAITGFSYARAGTSVTVQLNGNAATREDLIAYRSALTSNVHFSDPKYAQSYITKKTDIDFTLTTTIK